MARSASPALGADEQPAASADANGAAARPKRKDDDLYADMAMDGGADAGPRESNGAGSRHERSRDRPDRSERDRDREREHGSEKASRRDKESRRRCALRARRALLTFCAASI